MLYSRHRTNSTLHNSFKILHKWINKILLFLLLIDVMKFYESLRCYITEPFLLVCVANSLLVNWVIIFSLSAGFMQSLLFNSSVYLSQFICQSSSESPSYLWDKVIGENNKSRPQRNL